MNAPTPFPSQLSLWCFGVELQKWFRKVVMHPGVTDGEHRVFAYCATWIVSTLSMDIVVSKRRVARELDCSEAQVYKSITKLERLGAWTRTKRRTGSGIMYLRLTPLRDFTTTTSRKKRGAHPGSLQNLKRAQLPPTPEQLTFASIERLEGLAALRLVEVLWPELQAKLPMFTREQCVSFLLARMREKPRTKRGTRMLDVMTTSEPAQEAWARARVEAEARIIEQLGPKNYDVTRRIVVDGVKTAAEASDRAAKAIARTLEAQRKRDEYARSEADDAAAAAFFDNKAAPVVHGRVVEGGDA
jgi:hypothetical protein